MKGAIVTQWLSGSQLKATCALELMILLDDGSNTTLGTQLDDLRKFISSQPETTTVVVAYMRDGASQVAQNLTSDHLLAAKALRLPLGIRGVNGSPYLSLTDLVRRGGMEQFAIFLASQGKTIVHPAPARFFEVPISPPLPEDFSYIP